MNAAFIILNQLVKMAIYCAIGYYLHKKKMVATEGCKAFSTLLLYVILPCVIISSFFREASPETTKTLLIAILSSLILITISIFVSKTIYRKNPIDEFSASFSNAGFMGLPIIAAAYGNDAVFYIAGFTALLNILQWTYGQHLLSKDEKTDFKTVILNPLVISFCIGLIVYFLQIKLPDQIESCIDAISACNSPIAMIILGYYLSEIPVKDIIIFKQGYFVALGRLILIPLISLFALAIIPGISSFIKQLLLIPAAAPVGINVAIYAQRLGKDYKRSVILICQSTILCIITMPFIIWLSTIVLG